MSYFKFRVLVSTFAVVYCSLGQVNEHGNFYLEPYFGYKNTYYEAPSAYRDPGVHIKNTQIWGLKSTYIFNRRFSAGLNMNFKQVSMHTDVEINDLKPDFIWENKLYYSPANTTNTSSRFDTQLSLNVHMLKKKRLDWLLSFGVGIRFEKYRSTVPKEVRDSIIESIKSNSSRVAYFEYPQVSSSISFRLSTSLRYFIRPKWGISIEAGLGSYNFGVGVFFKVR